ncbi:MAG: YbdK family carboxylate-amine ligase [Planctomycetes bacterium]|nr:YbdK family carboxylate-amine ligase [Planctomycetota bacterium]
MDDRIYTYGVEEEYLCTNREDTAPFNLPDEIWEKTPAFMRTGREAHRCVIETMSHVCKTKNELNTHLLKSRAWLSKSIEHYGGKIYAGGTHHTIDWSEVETNPAPYYQSIVDDYQIAIKCSFVFGMHVHLGGVSRDRFACTFNTLRPFIPIIISASSNSSHWRGIDTGLSCSRLNLFSRMPRTGIPPFMGDALTHEENLMEMVHAGVMRSITQIWYDMRYHPVYHTVEMRCMDMQPTAELASALALFVTEIMILADKEQLPCWFDGLKEWGLEENRWRAIRYGINASLLTKSSLLNVKDALTSLLHLTEKSIAEVDKDAPERLRKLWEI